MNLTSILILNNLDSLNFNCFGEEECNEQGLWIKIALIETNKNLIVEFLSYAKKIPYLPKNVDM